LIGNGKHHLIPNYQPTTDGSYQSPRRKNSSMGLAGGKPFGKPSASAAAHNPRDFSVPQKPGRGKIMTQHTGLPPRAKGVKTGAKTTGSLSGRPSSVRGSSSGSQPAVRAPINKKK
jgi:hypothetical protein